MKSLFSSKFLASFALVVLAGLVWLAHTGAQAQTDRPNLQTRTITKAYTPTPGEVLALQSKFSRVIINAWDRPDISVEISLKSWAESLDRAMEIQKRLAVTESRAGGRIQLQTGLDGELNMGSRSRAGFEIIMVVNMPASQALEIRNSFGSALLGSLSGPVSISMSYGNLKAGKLTGRNTRLELKYGGADVAEITQGSLSAEYGTYDFDRLGDIVLVNGYGKMRIRTAHKLTVDSKYADLVVDRIHTFEGKVSYGGITLGAVEEQVRLVARYPNRLNIDRIEAGFSLVDISSDYGDATLNFAPGAAFSFDARFKYGDLRFPMGQTRVNSLEKTATSAYYSGQVGTGTARVVLNGVHSDFRMNLVGAN